MTQIEEFTKKYVELEKKYDLPSLNDLNFHFEIIDIVTEKDLSPSFPLRYTRRIMVNIFYSWINYLHNFIMPNAQSAILMKESEALTDDQRENVNKLIKEIMFINRLSTKLDIELSEEKDAEFIKKYYKEWLSLKDMILDLAQINVDSWKKEMPAESESYFG